MDFFEGCIGTILMPLRRGLENAALAVTEFMIVMHDHRQQQASIEKNTDLIRDERTEIARTMEPARSSGSAHPLAGIMEDASKGFMDPIHQMVVDIDTDNYRPLADQGDKGTITGHAASAISYCLLGSGISGLRCSAAQFFEMRRYI